jgi:hypothetical protein
LLFEKLDREFRHVVGKPHNLHGSVIDIGIRSVNWITQPAG